MGVCWFSCLSNGFVSFFGFLGFLTLFFFFFPSLSLSLFCIGVCVCVFMVCFLLLVVFLFMKRAVIVWFPWFSFGNGD